MSESFPALDPTIVETLRGVSTPTITTILLKKGDAKRLDPRRTAGHLTR